MDVEDAEADVVLARLRAALQAVQEPMVGMGHDSGAR